MADSKKCCGLLDCFKKRSRNITKPAESQEEQKTKPKMAATVTQQKPPAPNAPAETTNPTNPPGLDYRRLSVVTSPDDPCFAACFPANVQNTRKILGECTFCHKDITLDVTTCWNCNGKYCFEHKYPNQHRCPNNMMFEKYKAMKKAHAERMAAATRNMQDPATG